ncbi:amidase family protein [Rhizobium sp. RU36D]|uniref:amidase n=1 Tax=Rhizobium sp. RU36D TaxID=1907415 RepID=UPI0009D83D97|nr:amidase family protein [Rhizobium sp. RU36D]SMC84699.1 amidase [Rhizobium sp. RU36D]
MPDMDMLMTTLDASALAELVRTKQIAPTELMEGALSRMERLNPLLNAVVSLDVDLARSKAKSVAQEGIFAGVPTLIKDVLAYPGLPLSMGGDFLPPFKVPMGSPYTDALDASGLVVVGKSATSELGLLGTTESVCRPPVANPWNLRLSAGGSSGGAVAAVASGMVPIAHASDGGGSIRGPSSFCGLFGFKPSRGRTVSNGLPEDMPMAQLLSEHCVTRSVRDSFSWLQMTERSSWQMKLPTQDAIKKRHHRLRIGFHTTSSSGLSPEQDAKDAVLTAVRACEALGHSVVDVTPPGVDMDAAAKAFFALGGASVSNALDYFRSIFGDAFADDKLERYTKALASHGRGVDVSALDAASQTLRRVAHDLDAAISGYDVLLCPTVPFPAFELGKFTGDKDFEALNAFIASVAQYTFPASVAGWPAMSVPLFWNEDGLPMGCHFAAGHGQDDVLLSLAFELEEALPWQPRLKQLMDRLDAAAP